MPNDKARLFKLNGRWCFLATLGERRATLAIPFDADEAEAQIHADSELLAMGECLSHPWENTQPPAPVIQGWEYEITKEARKPYTLPEATIVLPNGTGWEMINAIVFPWRPACADELILYYWHWRRPKPPVATLWNSGLGSPTPELASE